MTPEAAPVIAARDAAARDRDPAQMAEVHLDIRRLLQFLAGQQVGPTKAVCSECASGGQVGGPAAARPQAAETAQSPGPVSQHFLRTRQHLEALLQAQPHVWVCA